MNKKVQLPSYTLPMAQQTHLVPSWTWSGRPCMAVLFSITSEMKTSEWVKQISPKNWPTRPGASSKRIGRLILVSCREQNRRVQNHVFHLFNNPPLPPGVRPFSPNMAKPGQILPSLRVLNNHNSEESIWEHTFTIFNDSKKQSLYRKISLKIG